MTHLLEILAISVFLNCLSLTSLAASLRIPHNKNQHKVVTVNR